MTELEQLRKTFPDLTVEQIKAEPDLIHLFLILAKENERIRWETIWNSVLHSSRREKGYGRHYWQSDQAARGQMDKAVSRDLAFLFRHGRFDPREIPR